MPAFALTIFVGAFLLFQVQPLIGKYILPWFGGSPGVWTTCMLFFQVLLLGGYAYAHALGRRLTPRRQAVTHLVLLVAALATLPITPGDAWKPHASGDPTWHILALLMASLGLPYLVLSATGPLMQDWFRRISPGVSPYRLYALSNVGSLLALISYPFYFETRFPRHVQAQLWSAGLVVYALGCGWCAWRLWRQPADPGATDRVETDAAPRPTAYQRVLWLVLPACASVLLLAVTNKMCQDVAVIPFLWVLPLALYLLTFIISFDSPRWYSRFYYTIAAAGGIAGVVVALFAGPDMPILRQVAIYAVMLFTGCMVCHGELYRLKPHPVHLTSFYLMIAAGGAAGGLFVALVAPRVFSDYYELHLSLVLTLFLLLLVSLKDRAALSEPRWRLLFVLLVAGAVIGGSWLTVTAIHDWSTQRGGSDIAQFVQRLSPRQVARVSWTIWGAMGLLVVGGSFAYWRRKRPLNGHRLACVTLAVGGVVLLASLGLHVRDSVRDSILRMRNFYGVLSVLKYGETNADSDYYVLQHGRITHGLQFIAPHRAGSITSYFGPTTGLGMTFRHFPRQQNKRVGLLGLGVGTVTAYGNPGDYFRIYEINPQVKQIADAPFTYLARSQAKIEVVMGDARLSMENEPPQEFDFLIMDAFSSDAVPVHLLTREAFEIYQRHLKPDGVILVNISNRYLNLRPVVENVARALGYQAYHVESTDGGGSDDYGDGDSGWWLYGASWMILSKNQAFMERSAVRYAASPAMTDGPEIPLWTDDYTSMFNVLQ